MKHVEKLLRDRPHEWRVWNRSDEIESNPPKLRVIPR